MIIDDLDVFRICAGPPETHAKLIVYADAVLAVAVAFQCFQTVSGCTRKKLKSAAA